MLNSYINIIAVTFLCCVILPRVRAQWLTVTHIWSTVDYDYPSPYVRNLFNESKEHVPEDVVMLDVDMYKDLAPDVCGAGATALLRIVDKNEPLNSGAMASQPSKFQVKRPNKCGRIFVTTPSLIGGTPASLSTLVMKPDKNGFPLLSPFPDWIWHNMTDPKDCHSIKSIFRIKIDKLGRLWAVDSGVGFAFSDRKGRYNCNPKILVFDLNNDDELIRSYEIDKLELDDDSLLLNIEVQIMNKDGSETYAYIADSMGTKMLIYDYAKDDLHVYQHPYFYPDPAFGFYHVNGKEFTVTDGLFSIVLDERTDTLFFHTLSSGRECSAPAGLLRNRTMSEEQARKFTRSPERPFHVSTEVITDNGLIIFPSLEHNSLFVWDTRMPYTMDNFMLVAKDDEALQFPTGMKIVGETFIMMTARLQNMLVTGVPNRGEINYRILMGNVDHLKSLYSRYSSRVGSKHVSSKHVSSKHVSGKHPSGKHGPATSYAYSRTNFYKKFPYSHFSTEF